MSIEETGTGIEKCHSQNGFPGLFIEIMNGSGFSLDKHPEIAYVVPLNFQGLVFL